MNASADRLAENPFCDSRRFEFPRFFQNYPPFSKVPSSELNSESFLEKRERERGKKGRNRRFLPLNHPITFDELRR